jgi:hypothetical protein
MLREMDHDDDIRRLASWKTADRRAETLNEAFSPGKLTMSYIITDNVMRLCFRVNPFQRRGDMVLRSERGR